MNKSTNVLFCITLPTDLYDLCHVLSFFSLKYLEHMDRKANYEVLVKNTECKMSLKQMLELTRFSLIRT